MIDFGDITFTQSLSLLLFSVPALSLLYALDIIFYTRGCVWGVFLSWRESQFIYFFANGTKTNPKIIRNFAIPLVFHIFNHHNFTNTSISQYLSTFISITGESQVEVRISIYAITCYRTQENPRNTEHDRSRRRQNSNKKKINEPC